MGLTGTTVSHLTHLERSVTATTLTMVQSLSINKDRRVMRDKKIYWKLGLSEDQSARKTIKYLEERAYRCRENASKAVAQDAVCRINVG